MGTLSSDLLGGEGPTLLVANRDQFAGVSGLVCAMSPISRRKFLAARAALGAFPLIRGSKPRTGGFDPPFLHGVASGDPLADRVILWARVSLVGTRGPVLVAWEMARDPRFMLTLARGEAETGTARDFTVKVDVSGLEPGPTYYYRFALAGSRSPVGRTRMLPEVGVSRVRLGVVSCANLPYGYFNAYACLARRAELDAVLHLGDYLYDGRDPRNRRRAASSAESSGRRTLTTTSRCSFGSLAR